MEQLKAKLPQLRAELENPTTFAEIYNYAYAFSREVCTKFTPRLNHAIFQCRKGKSACSLTWRWPCGSCC